MNLYAKLKDFLGIKYFFLCFNVFYEFVIIFTKIFISMRMRPNLSRPCLCANKEDRRRKHGEKYFRKGRNTHRKTWNKCVIDWSRRRRRYEDEDKTHRDDILSPTVGEDRARTRCVLVGLIVECVIFHYYINKLF